MKKKTIKRGISLLTTATLITGLFSGLGQGLFVKKAEAAAPVSYQKAEAGVNLIPAKLQKVNQFMSTYVYKENGYNITSKYKAYDYKNIKNGMSNGNSLSTNKDYWHSKNDDWYAYFEYDFNNNAVLKQLVDKNDIDQGFRVYLRSDHHRHVGKPGSHKKKWDVAELMVNRDVTYYSEEKNDEQGQLIEGVRDVAYGKTHLLWELSHRGCNCGSSGATGSVAYLIDTQGPKVTGIYAATDAAGKNRVADGSGFKAGETGYLVMEFDENIRFANNQAEELGLNLDLFGILNDQKVDGDKIKASLISLNGTKLVFKFKVPEQLNGSSTNVYIKSVSAVQDWAGKSDSAFSYVLLDEKGKELSVSDNIKKIMTCSSKITDLAGNPVQWNASEKKVSGKVYLDNVAPQLGKITASGSMITDRSVLEPDKWADDMDRSCVFAGIGDTMTFSCYFTEALKIADNAKVKAVLNVLDKNGNPVKLSLAEHKIESGKTSSGVDAASDKTSTLIFETLTVEDGMSMKNWDGSSIQIAGLEGLENTTDYRGNSLADMTTVTKKAAQQEYLDVIAPEAKTTILAGEDGTYTPISEDGFTFTFPVSVYENDTIKDGAYASGILEKNGTFSLIMPGESHPYDWYVSTDSMIDKNAQWKAGWTGADRESASKNTFPQLDGSNVAYLHVKLSSTEEYAYEKNYFNADLLVETEDYAGNKGENTFPLQHNADTEKPVIEVLDYSTSITGTQAEIQAKVRVTDRFGIGKTLLYEWDGQTGSSNTAENVTEYEYQVVCRFEKPQDQDRGSKTVTFTIDDIAGNKNIYRYDFPYCFEKVKSDYTIQRGTKENPRTSLDIEINQPASVELGNGSEKTRTMMLIPMGTENINGVEEQTWLAFMQGAEGDLVKSGNIFANMPSTPDVTWELSQFYAKGYWYKIAGTFNKEDNSGTFTKQEEYSASTLYKVGEFTKSLYGETEILFITSTELAANKDDESKCFNFSSDSARNLVTTEKVNIASVFEYQAEFTGVQDTDGNPVEYRLCVDAKNPVVPDQTISSLRNIVQGLKLENSREKDGAVYGFAGIQTENSYYALIKTDNNKEIYRGKIEPVAQQNLTFPVDIAESGVYQVKVHIAAMDGNSYDFSPEQAYFVDKATATLQLSHYKKAYVDLDVKDKNGESVARVFKDEDITADMSVVKVGLAEMPSDRLTVDSGVNEKAEHSLTFQMKASQETSDAYQVQRVWKIKAWSAADERGEQHAPWVEINGNEIAYEPVLAGEFSEQIYYKSEGDSVKQPVLPLKSGDNEVTYAVMGMNGEISRGQIILQVSDELPEFTLTEDKTPTLSSVSINLPAQLKADGGMVMSLTDGWASYYESKRDFSELVPYESTAPLNWMFCVADRYGNMNRQQYEVTDVDGDGPYSVGATTGTDYSDTGIMDGGFHFTFYANDHQSISPDNAYMTFDTDYSAVLLGLTGDERKENTKQVTVRIPVNLEGDMVWESYDDRYYGIYRTKVKDITDDEYGQSYSIEIWGEFKYDSEREESRNYELTMYAYDDRGNRSEDYKRVYERYSNAAPYLSPSEFLGEDGMLKISSYRQLRSINGYGAGTLQRNLDDSQWAYNCETTLPMISTDGEYTLEYMDLFGTEYTQTITVGAFGNDDIKIRYSETELTNNNVIVTVQTVNPGDYVEEISAVCQDGTQLSGEINKVSSVMASIEMEQNGSITVKTAAGKTHTIRVANIDKELKPAQIVFSYDGTPEPVMDENSEDSILTRATAIVICEEEIEGLNGKLSYTFPYGSKKGSSYTIEYKDMAGNEGSITAVLPYHITAQTIEEPEEDHTAPEYQAALLGMRNDKYLYLSDFYTGDAGKDISDAAGEYPAQSYAIDFTVTDESRTKLILKKAGSQAVQSFAEESDEIEGVEVSGNLVTICENAEFDLYLVDAYDNVTGITGFAITNIDHTAPHVSAVYEPVTTPDGYQGVRVWFDAENGEEIYALDTGMMAVRKELENGNNILRYYKDYDKNTTDVFNYKDIYGNRGSVQVEILALDTENPVVTSISWYGIGAAGKPEDVKDPVGNDIIAVIKSNKAVSQVKLYWYDEQAADKKGAEITENDLVKAEFTGDNVTITYKNNTDKQIVAEITASGNGRNVTKVLQKIQCMDRQKPQITVEREELTADHLGKVYVFTADEPVLFSEDTQTPEYRQGYEWTALENGEKTLKFTDRAGNITEYTVNVTEIDDTPLTLKFSKAQDGSNAVDSAADLNLQEGESVYVQSNKDASVSINESEVSIGAGEWKEFRLDMENGIYILKAVDRVTGKEVYEKLMIQLKDSMAPVIKFDHTAVYLTEEVSAEEMKEAVLAGVTVTDNRDGIISDYSVDGIPQEVIPGYYTIRFEAADRAGNRSIAERTLYIAYKNEPAVLINGEKALPYGVTAVHTNQITAEIEGVMQQGLVMKWKAGIKTTGQMKYNASVIEENQTIQMTQPGFYTLYIRTRDRKEYVTYIYADYSLTQQGGIE